jgi:hypothetical protein
MNASPSLSLPDLAASQSGTLVTRNNAPRTGKVQDGSGGSSLPKHVLPVRLFPEKRTR